MNECRYPDLTDEAIQEARDLIGVDLRRHPRWTEAGKEMIIRFALAIGSRNPLYISEELVSTNLFGACWHTPLSSTALTDAFVAPKLPGIHAILGGTDWEFFRPVLLHDRISATARLLDVVKKTGDFCGLMAIETGEVVYSNQEGGGRSQGHILRDTYSQGYRPLTGKYMNVTRYRYSPEDLETIDRAYEAEEIRGDVPRYWEDVQVGEQIPPIVKGPLQRRHAELRRHSQGHSDLLLFSGPRRRHPDDVYWDPETGMPDSWDASMIRTRWPRNSASPSPTTRALRGSAGWRTWSPTGPAT